ncbi:PREDICTED: uncharacterized protein LOC100632362 isoform X1 [Amphimedon queenslandica]|uniref:Ras-GEF domain-containing protein n=3 Tax=Amphimedon queenslandica TaxID=400682 RepID=A0AAN0IYX2_AMPQE|nr:PREDICTED: uncharacterized protein LOC100632362 isoform X1 [Amphimedon queenslandica]|eukprot:XP_019849732.1 PREDICTED: uncharacterized protein LOC100632362 isoform X1 [Amphimedon queenslandica]
MSGEEVSLKDSNAEKESPQPHTPPIVATVPTISKPSSDEEGPIMYVSQPNQWPINSSNEKVNPALASPLTSRRIPNRSTIPAIDIIGNNHDTINDDDDVFATNKTTEHQEDKKLVDWVTNVFVPACKNLLDQCSEKPVIITKVQTYLRLLNNTIMFFCNEHQQSSVVSPSRSMSGLLDSGSRSRDTTPAPVDTTRLHMSPPSQPALTKQEIESSVAIKVLRSVSSSLLPPLLNQSKEEFSESLHREIVVAIQKISWKVEACISYTHPDLDLNIHKIIFDDAQIGLVGGMMVAPPPEEHKLQNSPAHVSRLSTKNVTTPSPLRFVQSYPEQVVSSTLSSPTPSDDEYFRPKATRRTTVSISKHQVQSLGLNIVDVTSLDKTSPQSRSNTIGISTAARLVQDDGVMGLEAIREKVLRKLAKEFPQLKTEAESIGMRDESSLSLAPPFPHLFNDRRSTSTPLTLSPAQSTGSVTKDSSPEFVTSPSTPGISNLKERTKSLEFDSVAEIMSPTTPTSSTSPFHQSSSETQLRGGTSTLPYKRRGTLMKIMKKGRKVKSFGKADTKIKTRAAIHHRLKSGSEFFSGEDEFKSESIELYSRGAIPTEPPCRDSFYLNIEVQSKATVTSPRRRKFSVSSSKASRPLLSMDININTNFPEFDLQDYVITRSLKDVTTLYDIFAVTTVAASNLPGRPDKKGKEWRQQSEAFLMYVAQSQELRNIPEFMEFIKPGDMTVVLSNSFKKDNELELLMTFFTPTVYSTGDAGTHHHVELLKNVVSTTPTTPTSRVRWNYPSLSNGRGSVMIERQEGEEETTFVIREGDKDALIVSETQNGVLIIAGTFEKLVEQLACEEKPDPHYVNTFLLGYRHFATAVDLITLLIKRFQMTVAPDASEEEVAYAEKWRYVIQLRVLDILTFWIKICFPDFLNYSDAMEKLRDFIDHLQNSDDSNFTSAAATLSSMITDKTEMFHGKKSTQHDKLSVSPPLSQSPVTSPYHSHSGSSTSSSQDVNSFTAIQIARQLTLMELEYLKAIDVFEIAVYVWESGEDSRQFRKNLDAYIARFNKVSYWVASEILSVSDEKSRALLIEKFIEVAKHCQELKNINTTVSLVTGLSLSSIRRLNKTWKLVNEKFVKSFTKLKLLVNPANNHHDYRKAINTILRTRRDCCCIPYFGVFMRDVTLCNYGNPKKLKNGLFNFSKLRILVQMFDELHQYQRSKYYHPSDDRTQAFCSKLWSLDDHDLYELSLKLEPREQSMSESED